MPSKHPKSWQQADRSADPVIDDALNKGYLDSDEAYSIEGFTDHASANRGRLAVSRSAGRQNISCGAWVTGPDGIQCLADCPDPEQPHSVHFRLYSKDKARQHVFQQSGGNPANLKYNPWDQKARRRFRDDGTLG